MQAAGGEDVKVIDMGLQNRTALVNDIDASFGGYGVVLVRMNEAQIAATERSVSLSTYLLLRWCFVHPSRWFACDVRLHGYSALDAARAFFRLPQEEKLAVQAPQGAGNACLRGFVPYGSLLQRSADVDGSSAPIAHSSSQPARMPDRKESFTVGAHRYCDLETRTADSPHDEEYFAKEKADGRFFAHNRWPEDPAIGSELRNAWRAYFDDTVEPLVRELYDLIAEALGMDAAVFHHARSRHFSECRCNYYLEIEDSGLCGVPPTLPGQRRISAHKDFTDFTILSPDRAARYPHLQIAARDGESYRLVPYDDTCVTVLLGEPMQKWSNDRWFAPLHRVDVPVREDEMGAKYTMAYFCNPDYETVIAAPVAAAERMYADITVGEHWWGMYHSSRKAFGVDLTSKPSGRS